MSGERDTGASADIAAARSTLKTVFGIDADDGYAAWFAEEQQRTSRILPRALRGEASLFDVRTREFDALLQVSGRRDDQPT